MVDRGTTIARLKKVHAERLLAEYDADPVEALTAALRVLLDLPDADWPSLLEAAPIDADRRQRLQAAGETDLDHLAAELNERRGLDEPRANTPVSRPAAGAGSGPPTGTPTH